MTLSRTDLAVETAEELSSSRDIFSPGTGITRTESLHCGCPVTRIRVATDAGAALLGRPPGAYVTVDLRPSLSCPAPPPVSPVSFAPSSLPARAPRWWWGWATVP